MADSARSFYGGDPLTGAVGGELGAGHYDGPEAHVEAPWKCPACGVQNEGRLALGCVHCGSGKPGVHVGVPQASPAKPVRPLPEITGDTLIERCFSLWLLGERPMDTAATEIARRAFESGWMAGVQTRAHQTMMAPLATRDQFDVLADIEELAPAGKPRRTIVAALELFRDQVLPQAEAEIASGEWCSIAEVDAILVQLHSEDE